MTKTTEVNEINDRLADLVKQVQAGDEVLLTLGREPVARIVPASKKPATGPALQIHSFKGHRVLTPEISQSEIAEEIFPRR